ncbi:MAG: hypothetical protein EXQ86_08370 [Rhodospirillales bacterium]|nr:hypothetical protein [Rhodospirillales bacterium]
MLGTWASLSLIFIGLPQGAHAQSLEEALVMAYGSNPTLLGQRARVRTTDEQVSQALANWRPTVSVTGDASSEYDNLSTRSAGLRRQHTDPKTASITLSQPLFRGGRTLAGTGKAENTVKAERARLTVTEQTVFLQAVTAYLDVFRDQAVLDLNRGNEQVLKRQLEAAQDRFQVGEITRTDVHQAEARLAKSVADRIQGEGNLEVSRATYQNVVGELPRSRLVLPPNPMDIPTGKDESMRIATLSNPNVVAAEYDQRSAQDNVDLVWGELLPSLKLSATGTRALEDSAVGSLQTNAVAKLELTIPLYEQGAVYSRVREAKQRVAELRETIDKQRRDAMQAASRSWETLESARARVDAFQAQIRAAEIAFEGVEREAAVGSRTVLDVLDAEQELLDARVSYVRAQRDELVAAHELKSAIGQLTARHLRLPVQYYDPAVHYEEVRGKWFGTTSSGGVD